MAYDTETALFYTGREYPDGYGFALAYLDIRTPAQLSDLVSTAMGLLERGINGRNPDALAFARAFVEAETPQKAARWEDYIIEAAQFVLAMALCDGPRSWAAKCLGRLGHPGYEA